MNEPVVKAVRKYLNKDQKQIRAWTIAFLRGFDFQRSSNRSRFIDFAISDLGKRVYTQSIDYNLGKVGPFDLYDVNRATYLEIRGHL